MNFKSKREGENYIIQCEYSKFPITINANKLEETICSLVQYYQGIKQVYESIEISNNLDTFFHTFEYQDRENLEWKIRDNVSRLKEVLDYLKTAQDTIPLVEELTTLEDIGYKELYPYDSDGIYGKWLKDTEEEEVVEEIYVKENIHRLRTTKWETTSWGRHSTSITYQDLFTDNTLKRIIANTKRTNEKDEQ